MTNNKPVSQKPVAPIPAKQYDISNMTYAQKLEVLFNDQRFKSMEHIGENWKCTVCAWNGVVLRNICLMTTKDNAVDWGLNALNLVK